MPPLIDIIPHGERVEGHRPWPRLIVTADEWRHVAREIAAGRATLFGLWGDSGAVPTVHMAIIAETTGEIVVISLACPARKFPSVGALHPPAIRLERAIHSLYGLTPVGAPDARPWLDLGFWDVQHPLGVRQPAPAEPPAYAFLPVEGESLHQIPVGPVHAGIIEPGHFRFTAGGETVARLEQRLGYVHKGIESLMTGATIEQAARLAARTSGDSTVAYGIAFAQAVEAALAIEAPPRAKYLRALMAELERLANHFGDIGAICNDASFALMHAHCGILREQVLRAAEACFGHRLMMDRVVPGGVADDLRPGGLTLLRNTLQHIRARFPRLVELYDNTASLQDRTVATGVVAAELARQFGAAGYVGRASGRDFDARQNARLRALRSTRLRRPGADGGRCQCPGLDPHSRGGTEPENDRSHSRASSRRTDRECARRRRRRQWRRTGPGRGFSRRCAGLGSAEGAACRALSPARPFVVSMAAARNRGRRQHRRRLPALQ